MSLPSTLVQFVISIRKHSLSSQCGGEIIKPDTNSVYNIDRSKIIGGGRFEKLGLEKDWMSGSGGIKSSEADCCPNCTTVRTPIPKSGHIGLTVYNDNV